MVLHADINCTLNRITWRVPKFKNPVSRISRENYSKAFSNLTAEWYIHFENPGLKTASVERHTRNSYAIDFESSEILSINVNVSDI